MTRGTSRTRAAVKPARQPKTPLQRALETVGYAERRLARATAKQSAAEAALDEANAEVDDATARLAYAKADPALPAEPTDEPAEVDETGASS